MSLFDSSEQSEGMAAKKDADVAATQDLAKEAMPVAFRPHRSLEAIVNRILQVLESQPVVKRWINSFESAARADGDFSMLDSVNGMSARSSLFGLGHDTHFSGGAYASFPSRSSHQRIERHSDWQYVVDCGEFVATIAASSSSNTSLDPGICSRADRYWFHGSIYAETCERTDKYDLSHQTWNTLNSALMRCPFKEDQFAGH